MGWKLFPSSPTVPLEPNKSRKGINANLKGYHTREKKKKECTGGFWRRKEIQRMRSAPKSRLGLV